MLEIRKITKVYDTGGFKQMALDGVSVNFRESEFAAVLGPSGSGKTTLLNIIGGLDHYTTGDLIINEVSTKEFKDRDWDSYRNHRIGFVFQSYNLIGHQNILTNVRLALTLSGISKGEAMERAKQALIDAALFAQGLLRSKNQIWLNLPIDIQSRVVRELKKTRNIAPYENHWLLYTAMIEAALLEFTGECDKQRLTYGITKFKDEFYLGDSIYSDGEEFESDYYNSLIIHPMLNDILMVMRKYGISEGEFLDVQFMRSSRLSSQLERIISPEGTYPIIGRSLAYRCGVFHLLSQAVLLKILPKNIKPSQVRSALTAVLKKQFEDDKNFNNEGWLVLGFNGSQPDMCEKEVNTGSLYACCEIFLPLGLNSDDEFWSEPPCDWSSVKAWNGESIPKDQSIDF